MKIKLSELKHIINEELSQPVTKLPVPRRIIKEAWTSADDAAQAAGDKTKDALRPKVEEMLHNIYVGGYRADGAQSLYDMLESHERGQAKSTVEAMLYKIVDMVSER